MGTGLFFALLPDALRGATQLTGIEYDPVTARIARLDPPGSPRPLRGLHPQQSRRRLRPGDRQSAVRGPHRPCRSHHVRARLAAPRLLHRPLDRAPPAGWHRAVRQQHRHDGQGQHRGARAHRRPGRPGRRRAPAGGRHARDAPAPRWSSTCWCSSAVRKARRRRAPPGRTSLRSPWMEARLTPAKRPRATHPGCPVRSGGVGRCRAPAPAPRRRADQRVFRRASRDGAGRRTRSGAASTVPGSAYTCRPRARRRTHRDLADGGARPACPPASSPRQPSPRLTDDDDEAAVSRRHGSRRRHDQGRLVLHRQGRAPQPDRGRPSRSSWPIRQGKGGEGITARAAKVIRALLPIRDAIRDVLRAQAADRPWARGAGPSPHRLLRLHPLLRTDQPHRDHHGHRPGDRRRAGDASAAQPLAFRGRSGLLAGRQHRELRRRERVSPARDRSSPSG